MKKLTYELLYMTYLRVSKRTLMNICFSICEWNPLRMVKPEHHSVHFLGLTHSFTERNTLFVLGKFN